MESQIWPQEKILTDPKSVLEGSYEFQYILCNVFPEHGKNEDKKERELIAKLSQECTQKVSGVTKVKDTARVEFPSVLNRSGQRK